MTESNVSVNGDSMLFVLTIILVVGKLSGWFSITWLWVFSPLWLPIAFIMAVLMFVFSVVLFVVLVVLCFVGYEKLKGTG